MRRLVPALLLCSAGSLFAACGGNGYGQSYNSCDPPAYAQFAPSNIAYTIAPNAGFEVPPDESNPFFAITADGSGSFHLQFEDPLGAATCFTGLITVQDPFTGTPIATNGTQAVVDPSGTTLAFSGVPGSVYEYVEFTVNPADAVDIEGYVDGNPYNSGFYYVDDMTQAIAATSGSVAAFVSP